MEKKTRVRTKNKDHQHNEYKEGEDGYVDGYVQGADGIPYACVVIEDRIVLIATHALKVLTTL